MVHHERNQHNSLLFVKPDAIIIGSSIGLFNMKTFFLIMILEYLQNQLLIDVMLNLTTHGASPEGVVTGKLAMVFYHYCTFF